MDQKKKKREWLYMKNCLLKGKNIEDIFQSNQSR